MDDAHCLQLDRIVTNEELYILDNVKSLNFVCDECAVALIPCSYKKAVNLRRPYFKTSKNVEHKQHCYAKASSKIKQQGKTSRLSSDEGFPLAYPNRFNLTAAKSVKAVSNTEIAAADVNHLSMSKTAKDVSRKRKANYVTSSFQSIVDQYFDFPFDRDRALTFEGVQGQQYGQIFTKIVNPVGKQKFRFQTDNNDTKVFYSTLAWDKPQVEADYIMIKLSAGWWQKVDNKNKNLRPYFVKIQTSAWPEAVKTNFVKRLTQIRELVKGTDKKALVAFVGKQDQQEDFYRFFAEEAKLISFKVV
ncbi:hypothetical protein [Shewanella sp. UCD-KL21]|uniref:hypothetical protein n=1 Tax=Shewanella sp. UCD-KL21 TaxID=1917164 RepID=UPI00097080F1|nr:hypothetical protein [Shewanella sp. UCD-KL21]